ncbi:hypothetical protein JY651_07865 [Pyxidicoccus parkwayensis]|uniref:Lipoprotein n=1 Tax=Pyxidicoccus parkwayensis TaxID=2813578 RepID=A0ABX7P305_9BACT|nr:hypothetical protein [Pyxidicoccus parkwaysis]QSQ24846.1 hypothetical protein JY651_07865 [Pyxidicoccus parkwaysis]
MRDLTPTPAEMEAASTLNYPPPKADEVPDRVNIINSNWPKIDARCTKVRAAMLSEADGTSAKNSAIGAVFAGLTAGLAAASGLYASIKGDDANHTVTALLAFGATGTSVPTFFYFGSDDREKIVRQRIGVIDERRSRVADAWTSFKAVDRQFTSDNMDLEDIERALGAAEPNGDCSQIGDAARKAACEVLISKRNDARKKSRETTLLWHQATDALDDAVIKLSEACR